MIKSLQGLRVFAMLGIFLFHSGLLLKGTFPVTFFFMLSGFVTYYSHINKELNISLKTICYWVKQRMSKMYFIHIITFIASIFIRWEWILKFNIREIVIKAVLNILLVHSLFDKHTYSFNGLSWFLSTTFIIYIVAIPLIFLIRDKIKIKPYYLILFTLLIQYILNFVNIHDIYKMNLYTSPFYRVFDFIIGMLVAKQFINKKSSIICYTKYNLYEILIVMVFLVMYILSLFINVELVYYSPIFIIGLYIISFEKGYVSKLLSKDILQNIAKFSFEFYMVHELILMLFRKVFINLNYYWLINNIIIAIPSFIISIIVAILLNKYITKSRKIIFKNSVIQGI